MSGRDEWVLVLSEHRIFGPRFELYCVQRIENDRFRITEVSDSQRNGEESSEKKELLRLVRETSDRLLMKAWSRKKSVIEFQREVTKETLERFIYPYIGSVNARIFSLAREKNLPVFLRKELNSTTLYDDEQLVVLSENTECVFHFVRDDAGMRYFISLKNKAKSISLQTRPAMILSNTPAVILSGRELHLLENMEAKKVQPFFSKRHIGIPAGSEETYLKSFVVKTMQKYEVITQGIPVREIKPSRQAILSLEKDLRCEPVLQLTFLYNGEKRFYPGHPEKKVIRVEEVGGETGICWYKRDEHWERGLVESLLAAGLRQKGDNHFYAGRSENPYQLMEWLNRHGALSLADFNLEQNLDQHYYAGEVLFHSSFDVKTDWFDVDVEVIIGDFKIPFIRFKKHILAGKKEYVLPDRSVFILPEEWFEKYYDLLNYGKEAGMSVRLHKFHAPLLDGAFSGHLPGQVSRQIEALLELPVQPPALPVQAEGVLRPYQKKGFYWMEHLYKNGFGGCLADDMGLGKTLQSITLLCHIYRNAGRKPVIAPDGQLSLFDWDQSELPATLVVAPTSLLHNWRNELKRFAPDLNVLIYAGNRKERAGDKQESFDRVQVVLTSYGILRNDIDYFRDYTFQVVILDESQHIKNTESQAYRAVMQLSSLGRFVLTGTPIENSLEDLWAQFNFINEGLLGNISAFRKEFVQSIVKEKDPGKESRLKRMINPFILRRTKEEVTPELPPLQQETIWCDMTEPQQQIYLTEKNRIRNFILESRDQPGQRVNRFLALEGLSKLRQLACHPRMLFPEYCDDSGKMEQILLLFESLRSGNHKVLIFSSYVRHLNLLAQRFDLSGWKYAMLTGKTQNREKEIRRFTEDDSVSCFLISLKAGSTGLNLTAADYVFIIDPWWNPAAEMQALSRAHRIGQEKPVFVYRFISVDTIEEKIIRLQESKATLSATFISSQDSFPAFNDREWEALLD